jgi:cell division protein ZapE
LKSDPHSVYQHLVSDGGYSRDAAQLPAIQALNELWRQLQSRHSPRWWQQWRAGPRIPVRGLYLWGGVGRGKTWLMDIFYDSLPFADKQRLHFHRFMARVHAELRDRQSLQDPLADIAKNWASRFRVLCFDEFFVSDIADAMLLAGLFQTLFEEGVTLVATSNSHPDDLYRDGLQRAKFLPAIALIKQQTRVLELPGGLDFRLRILERSEIWHWPLDDCADASLEKSFERMCSGVELPAVLDINNRPFQAIRRGDGVIWFSFDELCRKPNGPTDYIEIARSFNTVLMSGIPVLDDLSADEARRYIALVDEFYERNVKLLSSAQSPIDGIYTDERLSFEFERTRSRLFEMQSHKYLALPHLP